MTHDNLLTESLFLLSNKENKTKTSYMLPTYNGMSKHSQCKRKNGAQQETQQGKHQTLKLHV